jgi:two-component system copper resistance phosphate regulon response regulator CusR
VSVLIIEDNRDLVQVLAEVLNENGFSVESAHTGEEGLEKALLSRFDCIILDIVLPGINGFQVVEEYRKEGGSTPVLILSALDSVEDKVEGFNRGADDYMVKPFDSRELIVRVRSLIRRAADKQSPLLACGRLTLDPVTRECRVDGIFVNLRRREFDILETMLRHANQVFTRERLVASVWKKEYDGRSNVVDVHVKYLRDKLRAHGFDTAIETIRGVGYKIRCSEE